MLKHSILAIAAALACAGASAANYYVVVPVKGRAAAAPTDAVTVTLNATSLPAGKVGVQYPGVSFQPLLQVSGDPAFSPAGVRWSIAQGSLPSGLVLDGSTGQLSGTPTAATAPGGQSFQIAATYKTKEGRQSFSVTIAAAGPASSCKQYLANTPGAASGWYNLDVDGTGPAPTQSYYCDMTSDGGGWTRVVRQTEAQPVTNWNGGLNGASYALSTAGIPAHTQIGFGQDDSATAIDYVNGTYTTGNIATTTLTSPKTGLSYQLHRNITDVCTESDPESGCAATPDVWRNTLTFDRTGGRHYTWAFSPNIGDGSPAVRGYAYQGVRYWTAETFAWTVWVR